MSCAVCATGAMITYGQHVGNKTPDLVFSARPAGRRFCSGRSWFSSAQPLDDGGSAGENCAGKYGHRGFGLSPAHTPSFRYRGRLERQQSHTALQHSYGTGGVWRDLDHLLHT